VTSCRGSNAGLHYVSTPFAFPVDNSGLHITLNISQSSSIRRATGSLKGVMTFFAFSTVNRVIDPVYSDYFDRHLEIRPSICRLCIHALLGMGLAHETDRLGEVWRCPE
jgi:hypothetical protein